MTTAEPAAPTLPAARRDPFGRPIDYLRISVTDRCNERCLYCMPEGYKGWAQRPDHLTADEIVETVAAAVRLGFRKFRLTGGEPLIRKDFVEICQRIGVLPGIDPIGVSTNATRLAPVSDDLKRAGVESLNISLDALQPDVYRRITGTDPAPVFEGIEAARRTGFPNIKLNCVLLRGLNETEFLPLIEFAGARQIPIRFIELMPLSRRDALNPANFFSCDELMRRLEAEGGLRPLPDFRPGHGPARYYAFGSNDARVGFIGALTAPRFCESCNKLRLTADGRLRPCLGRHGEINLLDDLRSGGAADEALVRAIANKPEAHEFHEAYEPARPMTAIGG